MPRVSLELANERRTQVHFLRDRGFSFRRIAGAMGLPVSSVQNYLASVPDAAPAEAVAKVLELKAMPQNAHRGDLELTPMVGSISRKTVQRRIAAAGLARKGVHRSGGRAPYHTRNKPAEYGDLWEMDTKKLRVGSMLLELLVIRDVYTGCTLVMHHSATADALMHKVAWAFEVFGQVPTVFQTDNGTVDFSMPNRGKLRKWHELAFSRGVQFVQFIPEAEPKRNGSVESFNDWLQDEWDNHGRALQIDAEHFDEWLTDRLHYYNYEKPLGSTGVPPVMLSGGMFNLAVTDYSVEHDKPTSGCISFIRYISRSVDRETGCIAAVAPIKNPGTVFVVPNEFEGGYLRFDWHLDGYGEVYAPKEVDTLKVIGAGENKKNGRFVGRVDPGVLVGSFVSPFAAPSASVVQVEVSADLAAQFVPVVTDPTMIARVWRKVLKQALPEILPSGITLKVGSDGDWQAFRNGELLWTEQSSPAVIEHAREVL